MIPKLTLRAKITVEALRANRSLRVEIIGEISTDLSGDASGLSGDVSGLSGDVSRLSGNVSGLSGKIPADLAGDIGECEISDEERAAGIDIANLVAPDATC